ncbi:MAG TPA: tetratricopeptide repeat protein [Burkholderiaceae bacterium]|nr:tetratricopeptide repeat protein [Burkholderiaceae bacterium]
MHALLITDVVDSTRLTQELGDAAMADLWARHDRAARDLLPNWRGREIDKTDGMLLLFDSVGDAVGYALAYQRAIAALALPFKARAGLHVGPVHLRANPPDDVARGAKPLQVDGIALAIAARVMSVALGGQTLLSASARGALGDVPERVVSHGHWRLQGLADPIELFEIGAEQAPFTAPPDAPKAYRVVRQGELWLPLAQIKHSLPAERDRFVGRREPLLDLAGKFEGGARLVSVLGMGGTGKTRLVTRFAWTWLGDFPGGVWFCDLSQARTLDGICFAVAQGLDVPLGQTDPVVQLAHAIAGRGRCLLILDNFEQVARHAEPTLGHWLDRAPQAQFVVTTREVLGIAGEQALMLDPLPADDATTLFLRRAEAARHAFRPDASDMAAIRQLVKVLDGLPLAIELAAARVRVMAPGALLARMNERFDILLSRAGRRDRQATLRAAFDWSWELLSGVERAALAKLSVFEGGFTAESAEAVLELPTSLETPATIDVVQWLVDKSFVRQIEDERFDLLESVREYAAEHLRTEGRFEGSGPACRAAAESRHWAHFSGFDERAAAAHRCVEVNNLVAACRRATAGDAVGAAVATLVGAWAGLRLSGPFRVAVDLAQQVDALTGLDAAQRALVCWVRGSALDMMGNTAGAKAQFDRGLAESQGDPRTRARLLQAIGTHQTQTGHHDAAAESLRDALQQALDIADRSMQAFVLNGLGRLLDQQGRLQEARQRYDSALALARELGDRRLEGGLLGNLGGLEYDRGNLEAARGLYEQALAMARDVGDRRWEGNARCNLGLIKQEQGHDDDALAEFETALALARGIGHVRLEYTVLCNLGITLSALGRLDDARNHLDNAVGAAHQAADRRSEGQFRGYLAVVLARLEQWDAARACLAIGEQLLVEAADPLSHALVLCQRAEVEMLADQPQAARAAIELARGMAARLEAGPGSELGRRLSAFDTLTAPP